MPRTPKIPKRFEKPGSLLLKVQLPLLANHDDNLALAYNEDGSYDVFMRITPELVKHMRGELKRFFYAHYDRKNNNTVLEDDAEWQHW